ncbi:helix-turn-helix domain-containing protein [Catenovulum sediminis]|uniref:helix-turn-helix domain-containing protein n=1 Tax=Catenovulum sediminis TaxID=1740262 RepID=UPI001FE25402|nr:AraC family transcriptional regulator [Catenovulum sediminis]
MFSDSEALFRFLVMPVISTQIIFSVMIYFVLVRKQISREYQYYVIFLGCLAYFLFGRSLQHFSEPDISQGLLYSRVFLLFAIGMPALVIGASLHAGFRKNAYLLLPPCLAGLLLGAGYVYFMAVFRGNLEAFEWLSIIPANQYLTTAHQLQTLAGFILLVLPCSLLLLRSLYIGHKSNLNLFLAGALSFALLFFLGSANVIDYGFYYTGSVFCALCWAYAVFQNIRSIKGKAALLKDELFYQIKTGSSAKNTAAKNQEIAQLLSRLEKTSEGDLELYKMRVRDILNRLTDSTIEAGGDSASLLSRHKQQNNAIDESQNIHDVSQLVAKEAAQFSNLIADMPIKRNLAQIEQAKDYMLHHCQDNLDIDTIAKQVGLSKGHLMRIFKEHVGQTVNQYLAQIRIEKSKHLLKQLSVTETAFAAGFNNSNYFNTVFKKQVGCTPGQYKSTLQPPSSEN